MVDFKGNRFGVDGFNHRNPATAFNLSVEDILHFPALKNAEPHYFPGRHPHFFANTFTKPIVERYVDNLYMNEFIEIVRELDQNNSQEKLAHCFRIWTAEMLCGINLTPAVASLYIPLDASHHDEKIIDSIIKFEIKRGQEFWTILTLMPEFHFFLKSDKNHSSLYRSLLNCLQRNRKLEKSAQKHLECANEFKAAIYPLKTLILEYNTLITKTNNANINLDFIHPIDPEIYLEKFKQQLEIDLKKRENQYDDWINQGNKKKKA